MSAELANYLERLEDVRDQVSGLVTGLSAEALNWRPIEGNQEHTTNSLAVLATHIAGAEHFWIAEVVGGRPATRNREAEFTTRASSATELLQRLEETARETRTIFQMLADTDLQDMRQVTGRALPVRWCLLHVIDHSSLHLGHMQMTYQLWTGGRSVRSPHWFERRPHPPGA